LDVSYDCTTKKAASKQEKQVPFALQSFFPELKRFQQAAGSYK